MRRIYWIVGAVGLMAAVAYAALPGGSSGQAAGYRTEEATRGAVRQSVSANGTLKPVKVVNVGAQISGRIKAMYADFNDNVTEGQVLAELDDALLKAQLAQSEAGLASVEAELNFARVTYERAKELAAKGAGARSALDDALAKLGIAEAAVGSARARVESDRVNLGYAIIKSPVSGVVMSRDVDVGQTVASSLSAPQLFSIAQDLKAMQIDTTVAEADVGAIKAGMPVTFRVDAFPGRSFQGAVRQVRLNATNESNVVSYNVVVDVQNPDLTLLPGMTAYVQIGVAEETDVLRVANAALRFRPAGAEGGERRRRGGEPAAEGATVYVLDGGEPRAVKVTTGISDGKVTAITGGELEEGADVIVGASANEAPAAEGGRQRGPGMRMF